MENFGYFIVEHLKNNCPYLFNLFNGENGLVYLVVFAVIAVILLLAMIFLIDTFLGSKNILKFIKYKKACDSEIEKNTDNNYLFIEKKSFLKSLILIVVLILFIIFSLSCVFFTTLGMGRFVQTTTGSFNVYIISLVFIAIIVMFLYPLLIYWIAKSMFKIGSYINEKYVQFIRPSFRIKKEKRRGIKHD